MNHPHCVDSCGYRNLCGDTVEETAARGGFFRLMHHESRITVAPVA